ncbi:MAG: hypothetical protein JRF36_00385 [Deltaproteobacteria bacterium]|jgi:hypothetical protein|nr:hypothetical protein [Deltaproteobacteria bacterium]MBW2489389.1 hypothetical protein [Deltaproteobacteria bacterium]MBW2517689.1 hypothetical protein [Deltaproteobacteria bacterium]
MFSCIHSWQILKPHRHVQQNAKVIRQQTQSQDLRRRRRLRETDFMAGTFMIVVLNL